MGAGPFEPNTPSLPTLPPGRGSPPQLRVPSVVNLQRGGSPLLSLALGGKTRLCDSWTRREVLRVGGLSALGLTLSDWFRAEAAGAAPGGKAKSVILIFNC